MDRERDRGERRRPSHSPAISSIDTRAILKNYNLSSANPKKWQDASTDRPKKSKTSRRANRYSVLVDQRLDFDEDATRTNDIVEDEEDPLGVVPGGVFT